MAIEHQAAANELAERFRRGDEDSLREILRDVSPAICRRLAGWRRYRDVSPDELEEVVSNSLLDAWRVHGDYDPTRGTLFGWLLSFGNHAAANYARLPEIRGRRLCVAIEPVDLAERAEAPESGVRDGDGVCKCRTELIEMMRLALASLPEQLRLVSLADASSPDGRALTAELAADLHVAPATVRHYRRRARARLKAKLIELGVENLLDAPRARPLLNSEAEVGENGKRKTENGKRKTENGKRKTENGKRKTIVMGSW